MATNVITARFGGALSTRTASKYQYDYGQVLRFADIDLPDVYEVHFSNRELFGDAIKQLGNSDGVPIPDELFWSDTARAIYAWVYLHHAEDDGETVYKVTIPLAQRSRPSDVEPTPVQQDVIEQAIAALHSAMDETAAGAAEAAESATDAQTARDAAVAAVEGMEQYATRAETAAGQAEDAAGRAETAAETVESRVSDAETAATHAAGSATTAAGAASQAAQKAGEASTYATNAGASASQAQTYASNASESATAASGSATAAADSATAAAGYAGAASGSATAAERSADDAAGSATSAESSAEAAHTSETNAAASAEAAAESAEDAAQAVQTMRATTAAIIIDTASGAVVSVPDGADDLPMQSVKVMIEPKQAGSGDPSPDNVRPISGHDAVTVTRCGKNLANAKYGSKVPSISNGQMVNANGWSTEYIKVDNSKTYSVSIGNDKTSYVFYYDYNLNYLGVKTLTVYDRVDTASYFSGTSYIKLRNDSTGSINPQIQLELGSTATAYEPYTAATYTTDLPTTVYGGTLDVVTGELVVDRAMVDLGTLTWNKSGDSPRDGFIGVASSRGNLAKAYGRDNIISTAYAPNVEKVGIPLMTNGMISGQTTNNNIYVHDDRASTAADIKTLVSGVSAVYELLTTQTYHLTPQEVRTLLGTNTVMSEAGSVEITYPCDTKRFILKVVS